ncbi:DUF1697 domain-containing protein [Gorillibacterium timonense]|uniref:DUF1697 domain-containing protein n=1 Tax=Gorillibacterium timonense TaxID=1689269 RepID=UPI00071D4CC9|nr:DUF1697 domain-containing protein [Gorillibacterium timonense]
MKVVALFRGINVGGKNIVKMADLIRVLTALGLQNVKTYIQSGNVVFETTLDEETLLKKIEAAFVESFGFESNVLVRSADELQVLIEQLPFTDTELSEAVAADPQVEHLYVYFLEEAPSQIQTDEIRKAYTGPDQLRAGKKEIYFLCHPSIRNSKLAVRASKEFDSATVRNWKTVKKLYDMLTNL